MLNHIVLMGLLVADPELRTTPAGVSVATFRIAVDRDFKNKETGERETDFVTIVAWRSTAEFVSRYFAKGRMAVVEGRLQIRQYTDREGNKRNATEVVASNVYFGDSKKDGEGGGQPGGYPQGGYDGGYGGGGYGGGRPQAPQRPSTPPPSHGYPPSDYGSGFNELADDDDGDLPF